MVFSDMREGSGSKTTKIAIVAALHLAVGGALVKNINTKTISMPPVIDTVTVFVPEITPPLEPPSPPGTVAKLPDVTMPLPDVVVEPRPSEPTVRISEHPDPIGDPFPRGPATAGPSSPGLPPGGGTGTGTGTGAGNGGMRSAVLADANSCAKPDYPARAARNGDTGTVALALLVDASGAVSSSRVQHSSGSRELDRAAQAALSLCKFKPAMEGGAPTSGWAQISYVWTLD